MNKETAHNIVANALRKHRLGTGIGFDKKIQIEVADFGDPIPGVSSIYLLRERGLAEIGWLCDALLAEGYKPYLHGFGSRDHADACVFTKDGIESGAWIGDCRELTQNQESSNLFVSLEAELAFLVIQSFTPAGMLAVGMED